LRAFFLNTHPSKRMNFLCHSEIALYVARETHFAQSTVNGLLAGAVLGDFLKGRIQDSWDRELSLGIKLHRKVDAISNEHEVIKSACGRFPKKMRRIAPILIDVISDFFLATNWSSYQRVKIEPFANMCHSALDAHASNFDAGANGKKFVNYMKQTGLLVRSSNWSTIEQTTRSVIKRLDREDDLSNVLKVMTAKQELFLEDFEEYYPLIRQEALEWLSSAHS